MMLKKLSLLALIFSAFWSPAQADELWTKDTPTVQLCGSCHGETGNSEIPISPDVAGQTSKYLFRQLKLYKTKFRTNDLMDGVMETLSEDDMAKLAIYYSKQKHIPTIPDPLPLNEMRLYGKMLYTRDGTITMMACSDCHGDHGEGSESTGNIPDFPVIAGQKMDYLVAALQQFKLALNPHSLLGMRVSARTLDDADINALAAYLSMLK